MAGVDPERLPQVPLEPSHTAPREQVLDVLTVEAWLNQMGLNVSAVSQIAMESVLVELIHEDGAEARNLKPKRQAATAGKEVYEVVSGGNGLLLRHWGYNLRTCTYRASDATIG